MNKKNLAYILISLGSIPFIFFAFLRILSFEKFFNLDINYILAIYSLSIISFICGSHWGIFLTNNNLKVNLFFLSNFLTISSFFGILFLITNYFFLLQILILIALLLIDYYTYKQNITQKKYFYFRVLITTLVAVCLIIPVII
tara:strand:- start:6290 stop:6718 length:429 start_codon:yes stop_codon:yes gene_type:complete